MGQNQKKGVKGTITTIVAGTPSTAAKPIVTQSPVASAPTPERGQHERRGGITPRHVRA